MITGLFLAFQHFEICLTFKILKMQQNALEIHTFSWGECFSSGAVELSPQGMVLLQEDHPSQRRRPLPPLPKFTPVHTDIYNSFNSFSSDRILSSQSTLLIMSLTLKNIYNPIELRFKIKTLNRAQRKAVYNSVLNSVVQTIKEKTGEAHSRGDAPAAPPRACRPTPGLSASS